MKMKLIIHIWKKLIGYDWFFPPDHNIQKALCSDYCFTKQQTHLMKCKFWHILFPIGYTKVKGISITNNLLILELKKKKILELPSNTFSFKIIGIPCLISWNCWNLHSSILVTHKTGSIRFNMFVFKIHFLSIFFYSHTFYANNL